MTTPIVTLIVCPLRSELEMLIAELKTHSWSIDVKEESVGRVYLCDEFSSLFMVGGVGEEKLAEKTMRIVTQFNDLKRIICAGTAGRLQAEVQIGDVVLDRSKPLREPFKEFKVYTGRIMKSSQSNIRVEGNDKQLMAVAMEGESLRELCHSSEREYIEVRGITDFADSNVERDFFANQAAAMKHVAQTINAFFVSQLRG